MISIPVHGGQTSNELQTTYFYPALVLLETLGMPKLQSGGPRRSSHLDLPRDLVLEMLSRLNLLGDPLVLGVPGGHHALTCLGIWSSEGCHNSTCSEISQSQGSQEVVMPQPAQGPNSREAITPRPARGFDL